MIKEIKDGEILIAKIIKAEEWEENLKFYTDDKDFLQVATWNYNKGKHLKAHGHNICKRVSDKTNELIFIKSGKIKSTLFSENGVVLETVILEQGDILISYNGGHAYDILDENTQVLEVKNGPYPGLEKDKKVFEN